MTSPYTEGLGKYTRLLGGEIRDRQILPNIDVVEVDDIVDPRQHPHIDTVSTGDPSQCITALDDVVFADRRRWVGLAVIDVERLTGIDQVGVGNVVPLLDLTDTD